MDENGSDHYAAGATYEQLYLLSDADLERRGLLRDTLTYDVSQVFSTDASAAQSKRKP